MWVVVAVKTLFVFAFVSYVLTRGVAWVARRERLAARRASGREREDLLPMIRFSLIDGAGQRADLVSFGLLLLAFAVVPLGGLYVPFDVPVRLVVADLDAGLLFLVALLVLAAFVPIVSREYDEPNAVGSGVARIGFTLVAALAAASVVLVLGSLRLSAIAEAQDGSFALLAAFDRMSEGASSGVSTWLRLPTWGLFVQPTGFALFCLACAGALGSPPVDPQLAPRFGSLRIGPLLQQVLVAALVVTLFLGGWSIPYLSQDLLTRFFTPFWGPAAASAVCMVLHLTAFSAKIVGVVWLQFRSWPRLPSLSLERAITLGFRTLLPLALANLFVTALLMRAIGVAS